MLGRKTTEVNEPLQMDVSLTDRSLRAVKWGYVGAFTRMAAQFLLGIILARILGPEPFGLVALAWLLLGLGNLVADLGFSAALVQRKKVSSRHIRYVFTMQIVVGFAFTLATFFGAGMVAEFFHRPDATSIISVMGLIFFIQSLGLTSTCILERKLEFRAIQETMIGSYLTAYLLLGLPMALYGMGAWSLVMAQLCQTAIYSAVIYARERHPIRPLFVLPGERMISFGGKVMGANISSWTISNVDSAIVGRVLGVVDLGLYNRAFTLFATPMNGIVTSLQEVLFSAYSRAQDKTESLRRTYLASIGIISLVCLPPFAAAATVSESVIVGMFGEKWIAAAQVATPLALAMVVNALLALAGPLLMGKGRVGMEFRAQLITAVIAVPVLLIAANHSLEILAWSVLAIYLLRFLLLTSSVLSIIGLSWRQIGSVLRGSILVAIGVTASSWAMDSFLHAEDWSATSRLAVDIAVGMLSFVIFLHLWRRQVFGGPVGQFLRSIDHKIPLFIRPWLIHG